MVKKCKGMVTVLLCVASLASLMAKKTGARMVVGVPVLDVRVEPLKEQASFKPTYPMLSKYSGRLDTQLLYGELVNVVENKRVDGSAEWAYVQTTQKLCDCTKSDVLKPLCGYVLKQQLVPHARRYRQNAVVVVPWVQVHQKSNDQGRVVLRLSLGTRVCVKAKKGAVWLMVKLLGRGVGYVKADEVQHVSSLKKLSSNSARQRVVVAARLFVGSPYVWGGASAHDSALPNQTTGVDCSGLVYLLFNRLLGISDFPRNANHQYLHAPKKIECGTQLEPGDLIFSGKSVYDRSVAISHVMIYAGGGELIESTGLGLDTVPADPVEARRLGVRMIAVKELFGVAASELVSGSLYGMNGTSRHVYLARYLE